MALILAGAVAGCGGGPAASPPARVEAGSWDGVVAAARQEGKVVVAGPNGSAPRQALVEAFERRWNVAVEYQGSGGPEVPPRVQKEREAGLYQWDIYIGGTTDLLQLKRLKALDPIDGALLVPEVKDPQNWRGGALPFPDKDHLGVSFTRVSEQPLYVNSDQVPEGALTSWRDLLDAKWQGKILVGRDPRVAGYGQAGFQFFLMHPDLGSAFIRDLGKQNLKLMRDDRTSAQWLAQGKYPICICSYVESNSLMQSGLPVRVVDPRRLKEGTHVTASNGNIALFNRAPHPNAARLYINWVLSKEGSSLFSQATLHPSARTDVGTDGMQPWQLPQPGWIEVDTEEALVGVKDRTLLPLLTEVFRDQ